VERRRRARGRAYSGLGCDSSYLLKLSRGEQHAQTLVEFAAPSTLTSVGIARQALARHLGDEELPRRLVVDLDGASTVSPDFSPWNLEPREWRRARFT